MFGKLGQLADLVKNSQSLQENMKKAKDELARLELSGKSADGKIEVWVNGEMNITRIHIDPELLKENSDAVENTFKDAVNTALFLMKALAARKISE